jgi:hypothetical protein
MWNISWCSEFRHPLVRLHPQSADSSLRTTKLQYTGHTQKMYFSPYTGTTYTVSGGNCATSNSLLMLTAGPRDEFPRWRRNKRRLAVCCILRWPDLWLQCSVSFVHGLQTTLVLCVASLLNRVRNSHCTVITDLDTLMEHTESLLLLRRHLGNLLRRHLGNWFRGPAVSIRSEPLVAHEKLDSFRCCKYMLCPCSMRNKLLLTFETAPFFCVCPVYSYQSIQRHSSEVRNMFRFLAVVRNYLLSIESRPALVSTEPSVQFSAVFIPRGVKRPDRDSAHLHIVPKLYGDLYFHCHMLIRWSVA